jgi:hypothetical protein
MGSFVAGRDPRLSFKKKSHEQRMDDAGKGVILFLIFAQNALIKKNINPVMPLNWYPQTGISRQPLQLLLR